MALVGFKASPLPNPPATYDPQYIRQFMRVLETYFSQLDSLTPNQAQSYTADRFNGGIFVFGTYTTAERIALIPVNGMTVFDTNLSKLCVYYDGAWIIIVSTQEIRVLVSGVSATASVGTVTLPNIVVPVTGVTASAFAGSVVVATPDSPLRVTGTSANALVGSVTVIAVVSFGWGAGAWGAGVWGFTPDVSVLVSGVSATASVGIVILPNIVVPVTGVTASAFVGSVTVNNSDSPINVTGTSANALVGSVTVTAGSLISVTGTSANALVGSVVVAVINSGWGMGAWSGGVWGS